MRKFFFAIIICVLFVVACVDDTPDTTPAPDTTSNQTSPTDTIPRDSLVFTQYRTPEELADSLTLAPLSPIGRARRLWRSFYRDCRIGGNDYNINDFDFLGVGSPKRLGGIINKESTVSSIPLDTNLFAAEELKKIRNYGPEAPCNIASKRELALNTLFEGTLNVGEDMGQELKAKIEAAFNQKKDVTIAVKNWQKSEINTAWLSHYLQAGSNINTKKIYLDELKREGNVIIAKSITAKGLTLDINTLTELSVEAQQKLQANPSLRIGELMFKLSLKSKSDKVIQATCNEEFMVYAYLMEAKKVPTN